LLAASALLLAAPWRGAAAAARAARLAAAWDDAEGRHHAGLIDLRETLQVVDGIELPTRAHGLWVEPDGSLLVVARRPGDWLLRWRPGGKPQWRWSEPERRYSGHVLAAHGRLYTTEADLDSGAARLVMRDARTLDVLGDWPTHGIDAHQLIADADGSLLVANGGVPTRPETGRVKLDRAGMDPSLVRLDARTGARLGQWRLADPRLSIRHLARHAGGTVGVALQAEHDDAAQRDTAPLLALFDGRTLRLADPAPHALDGYSGDIVADADGFVLAATRAGRLARWSPTGHWLGATQLADACPLATTGGALWAGGSAAVVQQVDGANARSHGVSALRLDNHWIAWNRVSAPTAS
jgi:hypothetical protein